MKTKPTIKFQNIREAVLYAAELSGQISDGHWENSRPFDHWEIMCDAEVSVDEENPGLNFSPRRKYNFNDKDLVECVADRMRMYVAIAENYPHLADVMLQDRLAMDFDPILGCTADVVIARKKDSYWKDKLAAGMKQFGTDSEDELQKINEYLLRWMDIHYPVAKLRRDLRNMTRLVNR